MSPMTRTLWGLVWVSMPTLYLLVLHGDLRRDSAIRDGGVTLLWLLAMALNLVSYVSSRNRRRPPLVTIWFLGISTACTACLAASLFGVRSHSMPGEAVAWTMSALAFALLVAPLLASLGGESALVSLIPRPSLWIVGASAANLFVAIVLDLVVLGIGVAFELAVAQAFVLSAIEQQRGLAETGAGAADAGSPHDGHDAPEMAR